MYMYSASGTNQLSFTKQKGAIGLKMKNNRKNTTQISVSPSWNVLPPWPLPGLQEYSGEVVLWHSIRTAMTPQLSPERADVFLCCASKESRRLRREDAENPFLVDKGRTGPMVVNFYVNCVAFRQH